MREVCGTCRYNLYDPEEKRFYCDNEESDVYGAPTLYGDSCEDWEEK